MLGNSYTAGNSLAVRLDSILTDSGEDAQVTSLTSGGLKLSEHAERADTPGHSWNTTLQQRYDYVILQDQSQVPALSIDTEYWQDSLAGLIYLNQRIESRGGETILFMTWAWMDGSWMHPDYTSMQQGIARGYEMYNENITTSDRPTYIAPIGLAFMHIHDAVEESGQNATDGWTSFSALYNSDGSHPSIDGTYLAACVIHATITGESPVGRQAPSQISPQRALVLQEAAEATVFNETPNYTYPWQVDRAEVRFGPESGSIFDIEPDSTIGLNFNFTNYAEVDDSALVSITGPIGWNISWTYSGATSDGYLFSAPSDTPQWVQFSITSPGVIGGLPLANSLHQFSMQLATPGGSQDWYNFSLRYGFNYGAAITSGGGNASISPGEVITLYVDVMNLGNSIRDLNIEIETTDENGTVLSDSGLSISYDGWAAIVLSKSELNSMAPGEDARAQVQVQAPERYPGNLQFNIIVWDVAADEDVSSVSQRVSIVPRSGGLMTISESTCSADTSPGDHCSALLRVENTGDVTSNFEIEVGETPDWLDISLDRAQFSLGPGQSMNGIVLTCAVLNGTQADLESEVSISLWLGGWSPANLSISVKVGEYYEWSVERSSSVLSDQNNLTSSWLLTNLGNEADGLVVSIDSNQVTEFGLIVPQGALADSSTGNTRSFELMDVPRGGNVEFVAWIMVPAESQVDSELVLTVEVRSIRDPSIVFTGTDSVLLEGAEILPPPCCKPSLLQSIIDWLEVWHEGILIVLVFIVGSIGVVLAIRKRTGALQGSMAVAQKPVESAEEWMSKFKEGGGHAPDLVESSRVSSREFAAEFLEKSGGLAEKPKQGPSQEIVGKATEALDKFQTDDALDSAIELADQMNEGEVPHPSNIMLDPAELEIRRVVPKKRRDDDSPADFDLEI
tara:strand:+ start:160 stop:2880 length:2721 start_codon:yes stop_codon:yes gene_type:complete